MTELKLHDDFKSSLSGYQPNDTVVELLRSAKIALIVGPSSAGKNTIIGELLKTGNFASIVSDTTRPPRVNDGEHEVDGESYHFRDEEEVLADVRSGQYLEVELIHEQQVSGIRSEEIARVKKTGNYGINEVDVKGVETLKSLSENIHAFFILPPSFTVWMGRMMSRGSMEPEEVQRRLKSAESELQHALDTDHYTYIINDNLQVAVTEIMAVLNGQTIDQEEHVETAWKLLNELKSNTSS